MTFNEIIAGKSPTAMGGPRMGGPRMGGPRMGVPRMGTPAMAGAFVEVEEESWGLRD